VLAAGGTHAAELPSVQPAKVAPYVTPKNVTPGEISSIRLAFVASGGPARTSPETVTPIDAVAEEAAGVCPRASAPHDVVARKPARQMADKIGGPLTLSLK